MSNRAMGKGQRATGMMVSYNSSLFLTIIMCFIVWVVQWMGHTASNTVSDLTPGHLSHAWHSEQPRLYSLKVELGGGHHTTSHHTTPTTSNCPRRWSEPEPEVTLRLLQSLRLSVCWIFSGLYSGLDSRFYRQWYPGNGWIFWLDSIQPLSCHSSSPAPFHTTPRSSDPVDHFHCLLAASKVKLLAIYKCQKKPTAISGM